MCMSVSINWMAFSFIPVILRQFQLPFYHFKIMWLLLLLCVLFYFIHFTTCFHLLSFSLGVSSLILFDSPIDVHNMFVCGEFCGLRPSRVFRGVGGKKWPEKLDYSVAFCSHRTSTNESLANCVNCHLLIWVCVLPFCALFATVLFSRFGEIMRWRLSTFLHNHLTFNYNSISFAFFFIRWLYFIRSVHFHMYFICVNLMRCLFLLTSRIEKKCVQLQSFNGEAEK